MICHIATPGPAPPLTVVGSGDIGWHIGAAVAEAIHLPGMEPELPLRPRLASRLIPTSWHHAQVHGAHAAIGAGADKGYGAGQGSDIWSLGVGLGWSLSLMWAAFLVMFLAWCSFYLAARSWLRSGAGGGAGVGSGVAGWRAGSASGGSSLLPIGGRPRPSPQRRIWV